MLAWLDFVFPVSSRFTFPSLHPDWMLLFSFTHTHVTATVTLALLFIPKVTATCLTATNESDSGWDKGFTGGQR